jgi:hypothetical protein
MGMNLRDGIAILECSALAVSWTWLSRKQPSKLDWRWNASRAALGCVSLAVLLDLINTCVPRFFGFERVVGWLGLERFRSLTWGLFAVIGSAACLSLVLGLLGKGRPRILVLAWFCFLLIPNASMLSAFGLALYGNWREAAPIRNRLAVLAGQGAANCGRLRAGSDPRSSSECVLKSFENHQPFYALYDTQEIRIDSRFIDGLAGDSAGNLYDVEFSSTGWSTESRSGGTQLLDGGHVLVEPCLKPITLTRSIYAGLTCIPRIADRQPQHPLSRVVGN